MDLQTKTIFLKESEKDVFATLKEQGIETKIFSEKFQYLFNKVYNNEVGYYSFVQENVLYKFIVLAKSIGINDDEKEKSFVNYLLHYYRINNKYAYDKTKKIPNSVLSLAFESNNKTEQVHDPIALFEFHKTKAILKNIEAFFQKHKHYKRVEQDYISQAIKHKLNLTKNIKEMNKSKIHQSKRVDVLYSQIATVSYYVLKLYIQKRLKSTDVHNTKVLKPYVMKINSLIARKYGVDKGFSLSLPKLYGHKVTKVFQKKDEYKMLLVNLRSLFGYEQLYKDSQNLASLRHDLYNSSFFIEPSLFYEWYVYDILKQYAEKNAKAIRFDKEEGTRTTYHINDKEASSNPDFILRDKNQKVNIVIDTKWKNITKFADIKQDDYLKLQFDSTLLKKNGYGTVSYLVYPKIGIEERVFKVKHDERELYRFNILEIDMNFANADNSLFFTYDFEEKAKELKKQESQESNNQNAIVFSEDIQTKRDEIVSQLIAAESVETKESLGGLFDEQLWKQGRELVKALDIEIILPEVAELLEEFSDVLEDESIIFLKSTSTIYAHYKDETSANFDFSMPASGLWKLIEVELNTSFIWQLRILSKVCDNKSSWHKVCKNNAKIYQDLDNNKKVFLSMSDKKDKSKLQSVMLGGIKLLIEDKSTLDEFNAYFIRHEEDFHFIENVLPDIIAKVSIFRNEHAHIKAMSKDIFEELWNLLFGKDTVGNSELHKLLILKRNMKVYINEQ